MVFQSRSIDHEINDVIEEVTEAYLFSWLRNLIGLAEIESENEIKYHFNLIVPLATEKHQAICLIAKTIFVCTFFNV